MRLLTLFCLLAVLPLLASPAPLGRLAFQSYGAAQGLENLNIWCLDQDPDGFLWVGTADGLYRYDGNRFQVFGNEEGLPSAFVRSVCFEGRNRMWIGTTRGLALRENGRIRPLTDKDGLPQGEVFALARDREGRLWVAMDVGLFRQQPRSLAFAAAPGWTPRALSRALWMDGASVYATSQRRLLKYDLDNPAAPVEVQGPWDQRLESIVKDPKGRLWVRARSGFWMRPSEDAPFQDLSKRTPASTYDGNLRLTANGDLLVATGESVIRIHGETWQSLTTAEGLPTPWTNRAMEDREGCIWIGGLGLYRDLVHQAWRQHTDQNGIVGGVAWSIVRGPQDRLLTGTTRGLCEGVDGSWRVVPGTLNQAFLALVMAPDGALWMGGAPGRLRRWVPGTTNWQEFPRPESTITSLVFDPEGILWVATRREGLFRVSPQGRTYAVEPFVPPGTQPGEKVFSLCRDHQRLWMAGNRGLLLLEKGAWRRLGTAEGLPSQNLRSVSAFQDGRIWVTYEDRKGIACFTWNGSRLALGASFDPASGFTANKAYYVREDDLGRVWAGTSQGAMMLDNGKWRNFRSSDGLPGDDCDGGAFLAEPGGNVWIGTLGGLAHFDSARYQGAPRPVSSYILSLDHRAARLQAPYARTIEIPRRDADVEFHFTGVTFLNENLVHQQIRLVGLEDQWRSTDLRQARYTRLPPGAYQFEVRAGFGDGAWGPPATLAFRVLPSWWQTWWFRTLAVLAALGGIGLLIRLRLRALERRNLNLERQVQARTQALAEANQALAGANQALHQLTVTDPLTGLKNRRFLDLTIEEDLAKVNRDYQTLKRNHKDRLIVNLDLLFLMVDLDHFKWVNDEYGHAAGDKVLQQVRDRLLEAVRDTDTVVRWGGEEFLVVARNVDRTLSLTVANRILDLMRNKPFDLGDGVFITKTASLGFALYPLLQDQAPDSVPWQKVVEVADRCLYAAKESGRNGWVGVLQGGTSPEEIPEFLNDPETLLARESWQLRSSFPETQPLVWRS